MQILGEICAVLWQMTLHSCLLLLTSTTTTILRTGLVELPCQVEEEGATRRIKYRHLAQVEQISSNSRAMQLVMRHTHDAIPVSRSNVNKLKELLG